MPESAPDSDTQIGVIVEPVPIGVRIGLWELIVDKPSYDINEIDQEAPQYEIAHVDLTPEGAAVLLTEILRVLNERKNQ